MKNWLYPFMTSYLCLAQFSLAQLPDGFEFIPEEIPSIVLKIGYATNDNFMGRVVDGYASPKVVLTTPAINALKKAQAEFNEMGVGIILFDAYRPQRAVDHFMEWITIESDTLMKANYYPNLLKNQLVPQGYIAEKSGHSRGSTLDLSLFFLEGKKAGQQLDMGGDWDFFGLQSTTDYPHLSLTQKHNRALLKSIMTKHGFIPYPMEWWHFTLADEPFPKQYFNF